MTSGNGYASHDLHSGHKVHYFTWCDTHAELFKNMSKWAKRNPALKIHATDIDCQHIYEDGKYSELWSAIIVYSGELHEKDQTNA